MSYLQYPVPAVVNILPTFVAAFLSQPCLPPLWCGKLPDVTPTESQRWCCDFPGRLCTTTFTCSRPCLSRHSVYVQMDCTCGTYSITRAFPTSDTLKFWFLEICTGCGVYFPMFTPLRELQQCDAVCWQIINIFTGFVWNFGEWMCHLNSGVNVSVQYFAFLGYVVA
jgi:hypothetical protein